MKNLQIKKELMKQIKGCEEYEIHVWVWTDGNETWAEVVALVDNEWCEGLEISEDIKEMKKVSKYLEKHFTNVNFHADIQRV